MRGGAAARPPRRRVQGEMPAPENINHQDGCQVRTGRARRGRRQRCRGHVSPLRGSRSTNHRSCKDQKKALAICLQRSPCVLLERHTPKECLTDPALKKDLPELCVAHFRAFMECRAGIYDMRKRMVGNAPLLTGKYDEIYDNLSRGNFDGHEEMRKLDVLNRNLSKQRQAEERRREAMLRVSGA